MSIGLDVFTFGSLAAVLGCGVGYHISTEQLIRFQRELITSYRDENTTLRKMLGLP